MILFSPLIKILLGFPIKKRKKRILLGFFFYVADIRYQVPYLTTNRINLSSFYQAFFYKINFPSKLLGYTHQRTLLSLPKFLLFFCLLMNRKILLATDKKTTKRIESSTRENSKQGGQQLTPILPKFLADTMQGYRIIKLNRLCHKSMSNARTITYLCDKL